MAHPSQYHDAGWPDLNYIAAQPAYPRTVQNGGLTGAIAALVVTLISKIFAIYTVPSNWTNSVLSQSEK